MNTDVYICWTIDCEATQKAVDDVHLGVRAIQGFAELVTAAELRATFFTLPGDAVAYPSLLRELDTERFELALHYHPQEEGHEDFCGGYSADAQRAMYGEAIKKLALAENSWVN